MAIFDFGKKGREEKAFLSAEEERQRIENEKQQEEEARKQQEEEARKRREEQEKELQEALLLQRMRTYAGFIKYTDVNCEVFVQAGYICSYDDIEFTAEITPEEKALRFINEEGKKEENYNVSFDIKMVYMGGNKCKLIPRIIFQEERYTKYGEHDTLSKVLLKNGENRYILNVSNVSTVSYNEDYIGRVEKDKAVYLIGVNTVAALRDIVSSKDLDKAIRVGYYTKRLDRYCINQIKSFLDTCEHAGIFEQEDFKKCDDSCVVLTQFNEETNV